MEKVKYTKFGGDLQGGYRRTANSSVSLEFKSCERPAHVKRGLPASLGLQNPFPISFKRNSRNLVFILENNVTGIFGC